jgi:hypothetical protein
MSLKYEPSSEPLHIYAKYLIFKLPSIDHHQSATPAPHQTPATKTNSHHLIINHHQPQTSTAMAMLSSSEGTQSHANPYVGAFQVRSWSHWFVLGAILWVFIAKN